MAEMRDARDREITRLWVENADLVIQRQQMFDRARAAESALSGLQHESARWFARLTSLEGDAAAARKRAHALREEITTLQDVTHRQRDALNGYAPVEDARTLRAENADLRRRLTAAEEGARFDGETLRSKMREIELLRKEITGLMTEVARHQFREDTKNG